ncbi:uncharacterized protein DS421_9g271020 [Arachis hypogaea]|nr:uncharacterized protein DS421_9g271020 [Arachis hypogaea]
MRQILIEISFHRLFSTIQFCCNGKLNSNSNRNDQHRHKPSAEASFCFNQ